MNKCYWVYEYFIVNGEKVKYAFPYFYYGNKESFSITFSSFNELYDFAKEYHHPACEPCTSIIRKIKYVRFPKDYNTAYHITAKNFSEIKYIKEYKEYKPTVKEAMEHLTVEQFKEYAGFTKEEIR